MVHYTREIVRTKRYWKGERYPGDGFVRISRDAVKSVEYRWRYQRRGAEGEREFKGARSNRGWYAFDQPNADEWMEGAQTIERRSAIADRMREWMRAPFVVFDCETTGLDDNAEIVQIGIVDHTGEILLDTLINPGRRIPYDATRIHGITDAMVADAPTFEEVYPLIWRALESRRWAGYNLGFDVGKLDGACDRRGLRCPEPAKAWDGLSWGGAMRADDRLDVMRVYAEWWGDFHDYFMSYTWQKLSKANSRHRLNETGRDHSAVDDAITTLNLIKFMEGYHG